MAEECIRIDGLHVRREGVEILRGLSLTVACGERLIVAGPNGAGKTTLMKAILGMVQASAGRILVLGQHGGLARMGARPPPRRVREPGIGARGFPRLGPGSRGNRHLQPPPGQGRKAAADRGGNGRGGLRPPPGQDVRAAVRRREAEALPGPVPLPGPAAPPPGRADLLPGSALPLGADGPAASSQRAAARSPWSWSPTTRRCSPSRNGRSSTWRRAPSPERTK